MTISNFFKAAAFAALAVVSAASFVSCNNDDDTPSVTLNFNPSSVGVKVGETATVVVSGGSGNYTVKTGDATVATAEVSQSNITVTGVKAGKTLLLVTDATNKVSKTLSVTVSDAISGLNFDKTSASISVGKTADVTVSNGTAPYTVASSDEKVCTATISDKKITIKAVKAGTATITVKDSKGLTGSISVTVK